MSQVDPQSPFADAGLRVGDVLLEVGGEPFFVGRGLAYLSSWLMRELDGKTRPYKVLAWRDGKRLELEALLALGPYR